MNSMYESLWEESDSRIAQCGCWTRDAFRCSTGGRARNGLPDGEEHLCSVLMGSCDDVEATNGRVGQVERTDMGDRRALESSPGASKLGIGIVAPLHVPFVAFVCGDRRDQDSDPLVEDQWSVPGRGAAVHPQPRVILSAQDV